MCSAWPGWRSTVKHCTGAHGCRVLRVETVAARPPQHTRFARGQAHGQSHAAATGTYDEGGTVGDLGTTPDSPPDDSRYSGCGVEFGGHCANSRHSPLDGWPSMMYSSTGFLRSSPDRPRITSSKKSIPWLTSVENGPRFKDSKWYQGPMVSMAGGASSPRRDSCSRASTIRS